MSWEKVAQKLILQVVESLVFPCFIAPKLLKLPKMQVVVIFHKIYPANNFKQISSCYMLLSLVKFFAGYMPSNNIEDIIGSNYFASYMSSNNIESIMDSIFFAGF